MEFLFTTGSGMEEVLQEELSGLGAGELIEGRRGSLRYTGDLAFGYRACLWSRIVNRVVLVLSRTEEVQDGDALYEAVTALPWHQHLSAKETLAVHFSGTGPAVGSERFGAQRVKDGIVDELRRVSGERPNVDRDDPDVSIYAGLSAAGLVVGIDLGGGSLHRRGYRGKGRAPLKENLAAALLAMAHWRAPLEPGQAFCDPMCGTGTLAIEAALVAADVAPGLLHARFGFERWLGHNAELWRSIRDDAVARDRRQEVAARAIAASDIDPRAVAVARRAAGEAGVQNWIDFREQEVADASPPAGSKGGVLVVNPPYGERMGEIAPLERVYMDLGDSLKARFDGWTAYVLSGEPQLSRAIGLKAHRKRPVYNGPIACRLLEYPVKGTTGDRKKAQQEAKPAERLRRILRTQHAEMFANRLAKNKKKIERWARREEVSCYRLYDADLPEFAVAVDRYDDELVVQEYAPPTTVEAKNADDRLHDALVLAPEVLGIDPQKVHLKVRRRQEGDKQYEREGASHEYKQIVEAGHWFWVNLRDYLDTGLFLDHRRTRAMVEEMAAGKDFLNLFCYTGSVSVYAARGGARSTTSVDLSRTYLEWAERNFKLNGMSGNHELLREDVMSWVRRTQQRYGLIFCDPPTFSNSKRMEATLDIQRDHVELIKSCLALLETDGTLIFSTNRRRFKLDEDALEGVQVEESTQRTRSLDFERSRGAHRSWIIRR
ncbi:MAG: bifunctional 23S rRNA (guanine(2069)-N(7))-methyltransferase RlmK/23S rRNA (guanine(2445)-N(2))-methyltransferase RlmL [Deltaproteobacteria bacterium]|nr:bifunctional 23S rRNA (guanine(2069)-N(7))-methyltransferase RlmK/23S rRNA (guanine(2445)-N(2))-methyltransferase RlmL [Deltaproteobacteria bacterium]